MQSLLAGARLLAVVAHYDDEALFCGGLLTTLRPSLRELTVAVVTGIETTSAPREVPPVPSPAEAERRRLRLDAFAAVCARLAATPVELRLPNLPQSARRDDPAYRRRVSEIGDALERAGLTRNGDTVLTHGRDGEYGHPQHSCTHDAVAAAVPSSSWRTVLTFGGPHRHDHEFHFDTTGKTKLIDLYRDQGFRGRWEPERDARLRTWTAGTEWFCRLPV
ncbi:PIG-L deacetylase family protein [Actinoplanes rectilineatus]|uniref:PIG-L deacetylase family protein n=1 Tax=Actinoplanes rectilineatus TaxID=113571 RepID=UPI0005F2B8AD|nr:PIG-L family deacetylase [Actinoplanes rectilineatus]